jgi:hypothetical protein
MPHRRAGRTRPPTRPENLECRRLALEAQLDPADEPVPVEHRQDVVAPATLRRRDVDLPLVVEAVERAEELPVPDERVERSEERDARRATIR